MTGRGKGTFGAPGTGSGGAPEGNLNAQTTGVRSSRNALSRGLPMRGLALKAQQQALDRFETDGTYELALENASRVQAVADCHWAAFLAEDQKPPDKRNPKTLQDLSTRLVSFLLKATSAWIEAEELKQRMNANTIDGLLAQPADGGSDGNARE